MEYLKRREAISLVVLCNIEPVFVHNRWMLDRSIITHAEFEVSKKRPMTVGVNASSFSIGESMTVYCDKNRFQIESTDVTAYQRIMDICLTTIQMCEPSSIVALGINSDMDFVFTTEEDAFRFGNDFIPLKQWEGYLNTPRVGAFTIQENHKASFDNPRRAINIQSLGANKDEKVPNVRISVNNHYPLSTIDELKQAIGQAPSQYRAFPEWYDQLFKVTLK